MSNNRSIRLNRTKHLVVPNQVMSPNRQRADSDSIASSSNGSKTKCRNERLIEGSRIGEIVGTAFVSNPSAISRNLVGIVSQKACQVTVTLNDKISGEEGPAFGSGGLLRGQKVVGTPEAAEAHARKKVKFEQYSSYEVTPVTAKHNLDPGDEDEYVRTTMQFPGTGPMEVSMPDGGCVVRDYIEVRPATEGAKAISTEKDDYSFGVTVSAPERTITKMPFLFQQVPNTFELRKGHKIGMAVFRTYEIKHEDAEAPRSMDLQSLYGSPLQACIYTGEVTEISTNGKTFGHDINTFEGCSGAVIFLLDQDQPTDMNDNLHGMAVGIHTGGLDTSNNIAYKLP